MRIPAAILTSLTCLSAPLAADHHKPSDSNPADTHPPTERFRDLLIMPERMEGDWSDETMERLHRRAAMEWLESQEYPYERKLRPERQAPTASQWRIGVGCEPVDPNLRRFLPIPQDSGLAVTEVVKDSPAAKAGLEIDDILVRVNKKKIGSLDALRHEVQSSGKSKKPLNLSLLRKGKSINLKLKPQAPEPKPAKDEAEVSQLRPRDSAVSARQIAQLRAQNERQNRQLRELRRAIEKLQKNSGCRCAEETE